MATRPSSALASGLVAAVAAGRYHTCAVTTAGAVKCWGDNSSGQLGNGSQGGVGGVPASVVGFSGAPVSMTPGDFDGDHQTDLAVFRPGTGYWYILSTADYRMYTSVQWGAPTDVRVPADYDGDGIADIAVWRPEELFGSASGLWFIMSSRAGFRASPVSQWGTAGDVPVPGDYDGDHQADLAVWRPSTGTWFVKTAASGFTSSWFVQYGALGDIPVPADYDGDGTTDLAVWRPSTGEWIWRQSRDLASVVYQFGDAPSGDVPMPGDYDGDRKADLAVWRGPSGMWLIRQSGLGFSDASIRLTQWGDAASGDQPLVGDFDGDGLADPTVYRAGLWYVKTSRSGYTSWIAQAWGTATDVPVADRYVGLGPAGGWGRGVDVAARSVRARPAGATELGLLLLDMWTPDAVRSAATASTSPCQIPAVARRATRSCVAASASPSRPPRTEVGPGVPPGRS